MKNVLVTGGCGFVGRRFVKRLLTMGAKVTIVDDLSSGEPLVKWLANPEAVTFIKCDVRGYCRATPFSMFDTIFHLAAVVGGRLTIDGDPLKVATDLSIDADFFNWCLKEKAKINKVVYFSSSAAYPIERQAHDAWMPLSEGMISYKTPQVGRPDMTYGWAKLTGEYLAHLAATKYALPVVIYRPFSGYGEDQSFDYPFPSIIRRIVTGEDPVVIWGSGDQLRDFIHIEDVVDAVFASMDELAPAEALNLGSGVGTSFRELAHRACLLLGKEVVIKNDPTKPEGVFARVANVSKMRGFYMPVTTLDRGITAVAETLLTKLSA